MKFLSRIIRKSIKAVKDHGLTEFLRRTFVFADRKIRPSKYFHTLQKTGGEKFLLFITGEPKNSTSFYRCEIPKEQIEMNGKLVDIVYSEFLEPEILDNYEHIVWYRVSFEERFQEMLDNLKANGKKIIYAVDDLLFDVDSVKSQEWMNHLDVDDKENMICKARGIREFIMKSDLGIVSTNSLKKEISELLSGEVYVYRNSYSQKQRMLADRMNGRQVSKFNLGFFSGSNTHDRNLEMISEQLAKLFFLFPELKLHIGGDVKLPDSLEKYSERIINYPLENPVDFLENIANAAIVLYPLERNRHNESKSELRVIQSGLLKRSCIASDTEPNRQIIEHGQNGMLVKDPEAWVSTIRMCLDDGDLTCQFGEEMYKTISKDYNPKELGKGLIMFLDENDR